MDELFDAPERRAQVDLNLVPVIDIFTVVIFFLVLSTAFFAYTKLTVPPSTVSVAPAESNVPPPVSPRFLAAQSADGALRLKLAWGGAKPGSLTAVVDEKDPKAKRARVVAEGKRLAEEFKATHPGEKTLQIGLTAGTPYQALISIMDGVRESLPDVVLASYDGVERELAGGAGR